MIDSIESIFNDVEDIILKHVDNGGYYGLYCNGSTTCMCGGESAMDHCERVPKWCKPYKLEDKNRIYNELFK